MRLGLLPGVGPFLRARFRPLQKARRRTKQMANFVQIRHSSASCQLAARPIRRGRKENDYS